MQTTSTDMTPRQRWLAVFDGKQPDRIPTDYWATHEFMIKLKKALDIEEDEALWRRLHIDRPKFLSARALRHHHPNDPNASQWGVRYKQIDYGTGIYNEVAHHPLAGAASAADVDAFAWPSPDDFDYTVIGDALAADDGYRIVLAGSYEPVLLYGGIPRLEKSYEDFLLDPEIAEAALTHIFEFFYEHNRRIFEAGAGKIDLMYLAEDLGSQTSPLFSLDVYKRFILPNQIRMADLARAHGVRVMYHTDGSARPFMPYLVDEVGIDMLNPLQWRCPGMEREGLVRDFGDKIAFHGGMDNQQTLPFGTVDDVINELKENIEIFSGYRWFCAPCHNIQAVSPPENIIALYDAVHDLGKL